MNSEVERTSERLWTLSNAASVFAIAQSVALLFATAGDEFRQSLAAPGVRPIIVLIILLLSTGQLYTIVWCNRHLKELERSDNEFINRVSKHIGRGRIASVIFFAVLSICALFIGPFSFWVTQQLAPP